MRIVEEYKKDELKGKRLFEWVLFDEAAPRHLAIIESWTTHLQKKKVPYLVIEKQNTRQAKRSYSRMRAIYKEKYVGDMRDTVMLEALVG